MDLDQQSLRTVEPAQSEPQVTGMCRDIGDGLTVGLICKISPRSATQEA